MVGRVFLVGAGPGDVELLTLKAVRLIQDCDVLVYDRLVSDDILDLAPASAERFDVGKRPYCHPVPQDEINALLLSLARRGRSVVRLKGGDPLMFGRGGEEALILRAAGVTYEVVPGITAAQGAAAAARLPLTHRGLASSVRYLTGHSRADAELDFDWEGLADPDTTLVVYMGLANIAKIARALLAHGRSATTPVLAVSNATRPEERRFATTLGGLPCAAKVAGLESPVVFIIGDVVAVAQAQGQMFDVIQDDHFAAAAE
ncbi:MAG: uroporphyrinogen-III C-methyltransferase [Hyphomicrobiaceae bacterium]|nr:uroporphyrinogen-III C-methyltransferase [Hyphomicrobiaceae bacterium]